MVIRRVRRPTTRIYIPADAARPWRPSLLPDLMLQKRRNKERGHLFIGFFKAWGSIVR